VLGSISVFPIVKLCPQPEQGTPTYIICFISFFQMNSFGSAFTLVFTSHAQEFFLLRGFILFTVALANLDGAIEIIRVTLFTHTCGNRKGIVLASNQHALPR